jgi:hypothetical protein
MATPTNRGSIRFSVDRIGPFARIGSWKVDLGDDKRRRIRCEERMSLLLLGTYQGQFPLHFVFANQGVRNPQCIWSGFFSSP